jgi:hypothetical protein
MPVVLEVVRHDDEDRGTQLLPRVFCDVCGEVIERCGWAISAFRGRKQGSRVQVRFVHSDRPCPIAAGVHGKIGIRRFFELLLSEGAFEDQGGFTYGNRDPDVWLESSKVRG